MRFFFHVLTAHRNWCRLTNHKHRSWNHIPAWLVLRENGLFSLGTLCCPNSAGLRSINNPVRAPQPTDELFPLMALIDEIHNAPLLWWMDPSAGSCSNAMQGRQSMCIEFQVKDIWRWRTQKDILCSEYAAQLFPTRSWASPFACSARIGCQIDESL